MLTGTAVQEDLSQAMAAFGAQTPLEWSCPTVQARVRIEKQAGQRDGALPTLPILPYFFALGPPDLTVP